MTIARHEMLLWHMSTLKTKSEHCRVKPLFSGGNGNSLHFLP
jgi:hypothetical protein